MALGRITGPLLKANLQRDGVDLAFETDLLYLSVSDANSANYKVGIKTVAHSFEGHEKNGGFIGSRPKGETRNILSEDDLLKNTELVNAAGKILGKSAGVKTPAGKLVHRNVYQVIKR